MKVPRHSDLLRNTWQELQDHWEKNPICFKRLVRCDSETEQSLLKVCSPLNDLFPLKSGLWFFTLICFVVPIRKFGLHGFLCCLGNLTELGSHVDFSGLHKTERNAASNELLPKVLTREDDSTSSYLMDSVSDESGWCGGSEATYYQNTLFKRNDYRCFFRA